MKNKNLCLQGSPLNLSPKSDGYFPQGSIGNIYEGREEDMTSKHLGVYWQEKGEIYTGTVIIQERGRYERIIYQERVRCLQINISEKHI